METVNQSAAHFADVFFLHKVQVIQSIRLVEMHMKLSVTVTVCLGPKMLFTLKMKGQVPT